MQAATFQAVKGLLKAEPVTAEEAEYLRALLPTVATAAGEPAPQFLTSREVSGMLRVCTRQIGRWGNEGKLHPRRLGRRCVRYDAAEIRRLMTGEVHA